MKHELIKSYLKQGLLILSVGCFLLIVWALKTNRLASFDQSIYTFISQLISTSLTPWIRLITELGGTIGIIILCVVSMLLLFNMKKRVLGLLLVSNVAITALINTVLKHFFMRARPIGFRLIAIDGYSFPSGHSMAAVAFYGYLIYLVWHKVEVKWKRNLICIVLSIFIILIMISRIYLGVHYASDVIGGAMLALAILICFTSATKQYCHGELK